MRNMRYPARDKTTKPLITSKPPAKVVQGQKINLRTLSTKKRVTAPRRMKKGSDAPSDESE